MASNDNSSDSFKNDSDEEFVDAVTELKVNEASDNSPFALALKDTKVALDFFLRNDFKKAEELLRTQSATSVYHAVGCVTLQSLVAIMTFESKDISEAMSSIKEASVLCQKNKRKENLTTSIGKALGLTSCPELTEEELHVELISAELNLFRSGLTFIQDDNFISFIKGAIKIRQCYQTYNYCRKILEKIEWRGNQHLQHFAGGVLMGCGTFNVFMSLLPPRIVSLLEWVGFTCNKTLGFEQYQLAYTVPNLRSNLSSLFILGYHLFAALHLGTHDEDLVYAEKMLNDMLYQYPKGVYFLLFKGRLEEIKGNFDEAISWLDKASKIQQEWIQFSHICYWEMMWCHAYKLEWDKAQKYAEILRKESKWSKAIYTYISATFILSRKDKTPEESATVDDLMTKVPTLRQRIAGKSIPTEKFVARKARKYFEQGKRLVCPGLEMLYCWSGMAMLRGNPELRKKHLELIAQEKEALEKMKEEQDSKIKEINRQTSSDKSSKSSKTTKEAVPEFNYFDDYCLLQLFKGVVVGLSSQPLQAELCFSDVQENHKGIRKDHYITPFALVELSWMLIEQKRYEEARNLLKNIKQDYKHYSMESKLHFRVHAAHTKLNVLTSKFPDTNSKKKGSVNSSNSSKESVTKL